MSNRNLLKAHDHINRLLDCYGALLTKRQLQFMHAYYRFNLSLQEVAIQHHVSRAAVSVALAQAKKHLETLDQHLQLVALTQTIQPLLDGEKLPPDVKKKLRLWLQRQQQR